MELTKRRDRYYVMDSSDGKELPITLQSGSMKLMASLGIEPMGDTKTKRARQVPMTRKVN